MWFKKKTKPESNTIAPLAWGLWVLSVEADMELDDFRTALLEKGISADEADQIYCFAPLALARAFLEDTGIKFSPSWLDISDPQAPVERPLLEQPMFRDAYKQAEPLMHTLGQREGALQRVLMYSPEFRAINAQLHGGAVLADLVVAPPMIGLS